MPFINNLISDQLDAEEVELLEKEFPEEVKDAIFSIKKISP